MSMFLTLMQQAKEIRDEQKVKTMTDAIWEQVESVLDNADKKADTNGDDEQK